MNWLLKYGLHIALIAMVAGHVPLCHAQSITSSQSNEKSQAIEEAWTLFHDKDSEGAIKMLAELLRQYPGDSEIEHTLGVFYMRDRNWDRATRYFQDSLNHGPDEILLVWNHIYLAEIFKSKNFLEKAKVHLDFLEGREMTSLMMRGMAKVRMDIRIMEELDQTRYFDNILVRFPKHLIPDDKIEIMGQNLQRDWKRVTSFLNLASNQQFEVFVYPTSRMKERFFPENTYFRESNYAYHQVHTLYYEEDDYLESLAPYAHYLMSLKYNRHGSVQWIIGGIDDAVRGEYKGVPVNTWVSELIRQKKIPSMKFLIDPIYLSQMDADIADSTAASFILYLRAELHPNDFFYLLVQTNLELIFEKTLDRIELDWLRFVRSEKSLLANLAHVEALVKEVEKFDEPPVIKMDLVNDLNRAAALYAEGKKESALNQLDMILSREPRYGEALYLKGKIYYDDADIFDAEKIFLEAIKYLTPASYQMGWSYYFLGRIARLQKKFDEARFYYMNAAACALPKETLEICHSRIFKIDKYLNLHPSPAAEVSVDDVKGIKMFLDFFDDIINAHDWQKVKEQTAYELNENTLQEFIEWYKDPERFRDHVHYKHELVKAEISENTTKIKVTLSVKYPEDLEDFNPDERTPTTMSIRDLTYTRFLLLTQLPEGWKILDFFDEIELYQ